MTEIAKMEYKKNASLDGKPRKFNRYMLGNAFDGEIGNVHTLKDARYICEAVNAYKKVRRAK